MPSKFLRSNCTANYSQWDFEPNSDIAGPGVIVGFIGTAWLVIALVVGYYFFGFDPNSHQIYHHANAANHSSEHLVEHPVDLQGQNNEAVTLLPPNAVDKTILRLFHSLIRQCILMLGPLLPSKRAGWIPSKEQVTRAFRKIITGLGILVSGYLSLSHNISAHHWKILVYLAWFSNVTHQAALMFLRGHLDKHPVERALRIFFMVIFYLMLLVAFIPTAFFNYETDGYQIRYPVLASKEIDNSTYNQPEINYKYVWNTAAYPGSPAQCYFHVDTGLKLYNQYAFECPGLREEFCRELNTTVCSCQQIGDGVCNSNDTWWQERQRKCTSECAHFLCPGDTGYYGSTVYPAFSDTTAFQSVLVSTVIMTFSFMIRLSKLYGTFSAFLQVRVRSFLSTIAQGAISWVLCRKSLHRLLGARLWSFIIMKPLIALYILFRLFFDFYASGISDIFWLTLSGTIGTINLIRAREPVKGDEETSWTFGQILPVFLLIGPVLMTAQEIFNREDQKIPLATPCSGPDVNEFRQTESTTAFGERRDHTHLSSTPMTREYLNHVLLKDYYTVTKWMKFAVSLLVLVHFTVLAQIGLLIVRNYPVSSMATELAVIILNVPALCYFLILVGLGVENRKYETAAMITCLLYQLGALITITWFAAPGRYTPKPGDVLVTAMITVIPAALGYVFIYFFFGSIYVICSILSRRVQSFISRKRQRRVDEVNQEGLTTRSNRSYNLSSV